MGKVPVFTLVPMQPDDAHDDGVVRFCDQELRAQLSAGNRKHQNNRCCRPVLSRRPRGRNYFIITMSVGTIYTFEILLLVQLRNFLILP